MFNSVKNDKEQLFAVKKQPLKRIEIPIRKFNDVAVPHHVDLLRQHKTNIEKFQKQRQWSQVHREQINATRLIKQLKSLLAEMEILRSQVIDTDLVLFDKLISQACQSAQNAIKEYLDLNPQRLIMPTWNEDTFTDTNTSTEANVESQSSGNEGNISKIILKDTDMEALELEKKEECLKSWDNLESEVQDIHQLFVDFARIVDEQKESVNQIESNVDATAENVAEGVSHLRLVKTAMYPIAGALIGGCVGGPIGLVAGIKLGGLAAIGCGVIGFTGGKFLKKKKEEELQNLDTELSNLRQSQANMKGSISLPYIPQ